MKLNSGKTDKQNGFSLLELLLVLTILGVVSAIAIGTFGRAQQSMSRENLAREFKANLDRARSDSIRRRVADPTEMAAVVLTTPSSYSINADFNYNGSLENNEVRNFVIPSDKAALISNGMTFPVLIMFDWRGQARVVDGGGVAINPVFRFCNQDCQTVSGTFNPTATNSTTVALSAAGDARIENGVYTPPLIPAPTITNVNGNQNVRGEAKVVLSANRNN